MSYLKSKLQCLVNDKIKRIYNLMSNDIYKFNYTDHYFKINSIQSIKNVFSKIKMKGLLRDNNIKSPDFQLIDMNNLEKTINQVIDNFPESGYIGKPNYSFDDNSSVRLETKNETEEFINKFCKSNYYLEVFINSTKEYNIHVSELGHCFYSFEKILIDDVEKKNINFDKPDNWLDIIQECQNARKAVGLDICNVDVKIDKDDNFYILNVNVTCLLDDSKIISAYTAEIKKLKELKCAYMRNK